MKTKKYLSCLCALRAVFFSLLAILASGLLQSCAYDVTTHTIVPATLALPAIGGGSHVVVSAPPCRPRHFAPAPVPYGYNPSGYYAVPTTSNGCSNGVYPLGMPGIAGCGSNGVFTYTPQPHQWYIQTPQSSCRH